MTDHKGDRLQYLTRIQEGLEKWSVTVTRGISHYLFYHTSLMVKTKLTKRKTNNTNFCLKIKAFEN